jgi:hypothetical protein
VSPKFGLSFPLTLKKKLLKVYKLILPEFKVGFVKVAKSQETFKYFSPDEI